MELKCTRCHSDVDVSWIYCEICGCKLQIKIPPAIISIPRQQPKDKILHKKMIKPKIKSDKGNLRQPKPSLEMHISHTQMMVNFLEQHNSESKSSVCDMFTKSVSKSRKVNRKEEVNISKRYLNNLPNILDRLNDATKYIDNRSKQSLHVKKDGIMIDVKNLDSNSYWGSTIDNDNSSNLIGGSIFWGDSTATPEPVKTKEDQIVDVDKPHTRAHSNSVDSDKYDIKHIKNYASIHVTISTQFQKCFQMMKKSISFFNSTLVLTSDPLQQSKPVSIYRHMFDAISHTIYEVNVIYEDIKRLFDQSIIENTSRRQEIALKISEMQQEIKLTHVHYNNKYNKILQGHPYHHNHHHHSQTHQPDEHASFHKDSFSSSAPHGQQHHQHPASRCDPGEEMAMAMGDALGVPTSRSDRHALPSSSSTRANLATVSGSRHPMHIITDQYVIKMNTIKVTEEANEVLRKLQEKYTEMCIAETDLLNRLK